MLIVVFASALAAAQSGSETAVSKTWKTEAASAMEDDEIKAMVAYVRTLCKK